MQVHHWVGPPAAPRPAGLKQPAHVLTDTFLLQAVADVAAVQDASTFVRPIYAGNALATVRVLGEGPRLLTVRPTAFAAAAATGCSAAVEAVSGEELQAARDAAGLSEWVGEDVRKSGAAAGGSGGPGAVCAPIHLLAGGGCTYAL